MLSCIWRRMRAFFLLTRSNHSCINWSSASRWPGIQTYYLHIAVYWLCQQCLVLRTSSFKIFEKDWWKCGFISTGKKFSVSNFIIRLNHLNYFFVFSRINLNSLSGGKWWKKRRSMMNRCCAFTDTGMRYRTWWWIVEGVRGAYWRENTELPARGGGLGNYVPSCMAFLSADSTSAARSSICFCSRSNASISLLTYWLVSTSKFCNYTISMFLCLVNAVLADGANPTEVDAQSTRVR